MSSNFVTSQYLHKDGIAFGTYCSLYSTYLSASSYASIGVTFSGGSKYECKQSWTYSLNVSASVSTASSTQWWNPASWFSGWW
jgi:hypothetical protein